MKIALTFFLIPVVMLVGCEQRYRYPCQDVNNWDKPVCQKPYCEVHKTCPEHINGE